MTIDPRNNPESHIAEADATVVDASNPSATPDSAPVPVDAPPAGTSPAEQDRQDGIPAGTAAGDPLAGVKITDEDAADAVSGDTGPEHPGERRSSDGGHA